MMMIIAINHVGRNGTQLSRSQERDGGGRSGQHGKWNFCLCIFNMTKRLRIIHTNRLSKWTKKIKTYTSTSCSYNTSTLVLFLLPLSISFLNSNTSACKAIYFLHRN